MIVGLGLFSASLSRIADVFFFFKNCFIPGALVAAVLASGLLRTLDNTSSIISQP